MTDTYASEVERSYRVLRERIVSGEFVGGQVLNQIQLAAELGTSRTPVREAIAHLASERLVTVSAGRGVRVATLTVQDYLEVNQLRWLLESFAARMAAGRMPVDVVDGFAKRIRTLERRRPDAATVETLDQELHQAIATHCGNQRMQEYIAQLNGMMAIARRRDVEETPAVMLAGLRTIVEALKARDADLAEQLMREHIGSFSSRLPDVLAGRRTPAVGVHS